MNKRQRVLLICSIVGFVLMLLFPPYFVIDSQSQGRIHSPIGYHPAWDPPSKEDGHEVLMKRGLIPEEGIEVAPLVIGKNVVLLVFNTVFLLLITSAGLYLLRTRNK